MAIPTVSVIIVNYNTPGLTAACIASLRHYLTVRHEVIVVENGSQKLDPASRETEGVMLVATKNQGFGAANNAGASQAAGSYLWFLNSDTVLPDSSCNQAFAFLEAHPEVGALTPLLYNDAALSQLQPDFYGHSQTLRTVLTRNLKDRLDLNEEWQEAEMVSGASLIVPSLVFRAVHGFDERFFMYLEDDDLSLRIRGTGKQVGVYTGGRVVHLQGQSSYSAARKQMYRRSQDLFWQLHRGAAATLLMKVLRAPYLLLKRP